MSRSPNPFSIEVAEGYVAASATAEHGLLLAVSGGADSMALLHATCTLWPNRPDCIRVAHVDHGLRPESSQDARFVAAAAERLGLEFDILSIPPGEIRHHAIGSLEESARNRRYDLLSKTAANHNFGHVVTAHHQDDQSETVLHNIFRGTGLRGLRGMTYNRELSPQVSLVRPMLGVRRADVLAYLDEIDVEFRSDQSNQDANFMRNRLRNQILPMLGREVNEAVDENLVSLANQAGEALEIIDALADRILGRALLEQQPNVCRLDRSSLSRWPIPVVRHVLSVLWLAQQWPRQKMTAQRWQQTAVAIVGGKSASLDLPGDVRAVLSGNLVRFFRIRPPL